MHTILGAGGTVANALTKELLLHNKEIRLVSRRPVNYTSTKITWIKADLLDYKETLNACLGSEVIYICNGVGAKNEDWKTMWPVIMNNAIAVAKETNTRLIFFDNTYMCGVVDGIMTEKTPYNPCTIKGEVRAEIAQKFMQEIKAGNIKGSIARAGGFYGTDSMISVLDSSVLNKFAQNKKAQWIGNPDFLHNFTYITDAGKGLSILGRDSNSDGEIWHMPTAASIKGTDFIKIAASIYQVEPKYISVNKTMLTLVGLFNANVASISDMYYQYVRDYDFNSSKFETAFGFKPTSFVDGITRMSETYYRKK